MCDACWQTDGDGDNNDIIPEPEASASCQVRKCLGEKPGLRWQRCGGLDGYCAPIRVPRHRSRIDLKWVPGTSLRNKLVMAAIYNLDLQAGTLPALREPYTLTVHSFTTSFPSLYLNLLTTHPLSSHLLSSPLILFHPPSSSLIPSHLLLNLFRPVPLRDISH